MELTYKPATRPYSRDEIVYRSTGLRHALKLSETLCTRRCRHIYFPKSNYQGESCSVCRRLKEEYPNRRDIDRNLQQLIDIYIEEVCNLAPEQMTHFDLWIERTFYVWLYPQKPRV